MEFNICPVVLPRALAELTLEPKALIACPLNAATNPLRTSSVKPGNVVAVSPSNICFLALSNLSAAPANPPVTACCATVSAAISIIFIVSSPQLTALLSFICCGIGSSI